MLRDFRACAPKRPLSEEHYRITGANEGGSKTLKFVYGDTLALLLTAFGPATAGDDEENMAINFCDGQPKRSATRFCNM